MPVVSNTPSVWPTLSAFVNDLPDTAKSAIFGNVPDAGLMNRLLVQGGCKDAVLRGDFDHAARPLIQHMERAPLGSWPHWSEWEALADKAGELRHASAHAKLLANLWAGSMCLSTGLVTEDQATYQDPIADVALQCSPLVYAPGRPPELVAIPRVRRDDAAFVSAKGEVHGETTLTGLRFIDNQMPAMCEAVHSMHLDAPARRRVVQDDAGALFLYDPSGEPLVPLPDALNWPMLAATSANGRYVASGPHFGSALLLHDCETGKTTELALPDGLEDDDARPWQLSVDSEGVVFVAATDKGLQLAAGKEPQAVDLSCRWSNYRLGPDERTIVVNDATNTNLRLTHRQSGASKTLLHPAADMAGPYRRRILSLAFSPGLAWAATTCMDGSLAIYDLGGTEHDAKVEPALHLRLRMQGHTGWLENAVTWFEPDGSAVRVAYTEESRTSTARTVQLMRLPLV